MEPLRLNYVNCIWSLILLIYRVSQRRTNRERLNSSKVMMGNCEKLGDFINMWFMISLKIQKVQRHFPTRTTAKIFRPLRRRGIKSVMKSYHAEKQNKTRTNIYTYIRQQDVVTRCDSFWLNPTLKIKLKDCILYIQLQKDKGVCARDGSHVESGLEVHRKIILKRKGKN